MRINYFLMMVIFGALPQMAWAAEVLDGIAVHVGADVVLISDVEKRQSQMAQMPGYAKLDSEERAERAITSLIEDHLVAQEVKRLKIDVADEEIEAVVGRMQKQNQLSPEQFEMALQNQGMTLSAYREQIRKQLIKMRLVQTKVKNKVQIPEEDVRALYATRSRDMKGTFQIKASHILVKLAPEASEADLQAAQEKIRVALDSLRSGTPFAEVAMTHSEGPSAPRGGALGVFGRGQMVPSFETAAFGAPLNEVVGPVKTPFGLHLIQVTARVPVEPAPYEKMAPMLRQELTEREMERLFSSYIDNLRSKTWINRRPSTRK